MFPTTRTGVTALSYHVIRFQRAVDVRCRFDLQRGMTNFEAIIELVAGLDQKCITGIASGCNQMGGQRCFGSAHRPDVKVVNRGNTGQGAEKAPNRGGVDP